MSPLQYTPTVVKPAVTQGGYQGYQGWTNTPTP
jgi:hypothetical protein